MYYSDLFLTVPAAGFTQRATIDPGLNEIHVLSVSRSLQPSQCSSLLCYIHVLYSWVGHPPPPLNFNWQVPCLSGKKRVTYLLLVEPQLGSAWVSTVRARKLSGLFGYCRCLPPLTGLHDAAVATLLKVVVCILCQNMPACRILCKFR